ncbi:hypothetical protein SDJN03_23985, partial [Cucurbita argyrosperma subsp. sororia]
MAGIARNNPSILNLTLVEAYEAVVDSLGVHGIMVVSDNHISQPRWCWSVDDGNGFFGDRYFDPQEWLQGIRLAAQTLKSKSQPSEMGSIQFSLEIAQADRVLGNTLRLFKPCACKLLLVLV